MFPRHVLEFMVKDSLDVGDGEDSSGQEGRVISPGSLASSHDNITIMFMDIVGFTTMSKEVQPVEVRVMKLRRQGHACITYPI